MVNDITLSGVRKLALISNVKIVVPTLSCFIACQTLHHTEVYTGFLPLRVVIGFSLCLHHRTSHLGDLGSMLTIYMEACVSGHLIPEADLCPDWFLLLTNCCGSDSWDALPYATNAVGNTLYQ